MRWALFGPTPGSRPSSSIRSWTAPSYMRTASEARQAEAAAQARRRADPSSRSASSLDGAVRVADGGDDQVLQRLDVVGVDGLRVDGERGAARRRRSPSP